MAAISASPSSWSTTRSTMPRDAATMGKGVGDDFRDGKVTLPVILAYARGSDDERAFWRDGDRGPAAPPTRISPHATALLRGTGAIDDTLARARHYGQRAIDALGRLPGAARPRRRWSKRSSSPSRGLIEPALRSCG